MSVLLVEQNMYWLTYTLMSTSNKLMLVIYQADWLSSSYAAKDITVFTGSVVTSEVWFHSGAL